MLDDLFVGLPEDGGRWFFLLILVSLFLLLLPFDLFLQFFSQLLDPFMLKFSFPPLIDTGLFQLLLSFNHTLLPLEPFPLSSFSVALDFLQVVLVRAFLLSDVTAFCLDVRWIVRVYDALVRKRVV